MPASPADELADDFGIDRRAAPRHSTNGVNEAFDVGDAVLEQIADALGSTAEEVHRVLLLEELREHEHSGRGHVRADLVRRQQTVIGVVRRHLDVNDRDVGRMRACLAYEIARVPCHCNDIEPCLSQNVHHPLPEQGLVLPDHDANLWTLVHVRADLPRSGRSQTRRAAHG